jgi:hypothetical protein
VTLSHRILCHSLVCSRVGGLHSRDLEPHNIKQFVCILCEGELVPRAADLLLVVEPDDVGLRLAHEAAFKGDLALLKLPDHGALGEGRADAALRNRRFVA